jgi:transcriptional regulator with XRE-family HTH domain
MDIWRLGDKVISRNKIDSLINRIFELRNRGMSQTEVAGRLGVDRTMICRLENLGEIRKGRRLAVIGFPIKNKKEIFEALTGEGVDYIFLLTEYERWDFIKQKSGLELLNTIMDMIAMVHSFDQVVVLGSNKRIKIFETVLDKEVVGFEIGRSPIREDKYVDPEEIVGLIRAIKQ